MEKDESMKRMDLRQKLLVSILGSFIIIMCMFFGSMYYYFIDKIEKSNEKVVFMTFEQAEKELATILKNVSTCMDKYATDEAILRFGYEYPVSDIEKSRLMMTLTWYFSREMKNNPQIAGIGILRGDGDAIVSLSSEKNRTGNVAIKGKVSEVLSESKENYPFTIWVPGWELELDDSTPIGLMTQEPSLIGIKAMGKSDNIYDDFFLFTQIRERDIRSTYELVTFNGSMAVLADEDGEIISNIGVNCLGEQYFAKENMQNIEYELGFYNWKLYNMIPKEEYMRDINDIRNFGIIVIAVSMGITVIVAIIWSRKYTRPIELLTENMEKVKKQEFDIQKPQKLGWEELDQLNEEFYFVAQSIEQYIERLKKAEHEKAEEELLALQYQMNPHFLLNSLNSIRWMAMMTNNTIVADTLVTLSRIITPMLRNPSLTWKVFNEIEFLENYTLMMRLRYGHDMEYCMSCPEELYEKEFPRFILQPLIENCFVHGSKSGESRTVDVRIDCNGDGYIEVDVINSGVFLTEEELKNIYKKMQTSERAAANIGLANVNKRLTLLYGNLGHIDVKTDDRLGFIVHISFPDEYKTCNEKK